MNKRTPSFKPPRKERVVRPSLSYKPSGVSTGGYSEKRSKPRSPPYKKLRSTYQPAVDVRRPVMQDKDLKKTRYKVPKAPKDTEVPTSVSEKRSTSNDQRKTDWGSVAEWYDKHLEKTGDTYHDKVVHPNLLRMLGDIKGKQILDLACGQGIFSRLLADKGASVVGVDLGKELIDIAEKKNAEYKFKIHFFHSASNDLFMVKDDTKDIVVCVLALQNIEKLQETITEVSRVLKKGGRFLMVLNHPAFRNPRHTHWGYDEAEKVQYRRVEEYLSESKIKIDMTPGATKDKKFTVSFHRPLQVYVKSFGKHGLAMTRLEEWESHKASQKGPRKIAEDKARKEIPLFLAMEAIKL